MNNANMPAMPHTEYDADGNMPKGLTKREYFAGLAMQGLCAHSGDFHLYSSLAQDALMYADALLAELEHSK